MAREMETVQAERAGRSHIAPVSLVKLTLYSDRPAATVAKTFYFSNLACTYDYGNTGNDQTFLPVILGGGDFLSAFGHIPEPDDLTSFGQEFDLRLSNKTINGSRAVALLQAYNLEGASIEVSQLLLATAEMNSLSGAGFLDLTGYDGDEHTVLFRGRVNRVAPITDAMLTIKCTTELPTMAGEWILATDDTKVDPRDVGKRCPRIYGSAVHVPIIAWEIGFRGTLSEPIDASEDDVDKFVDSTVGLPASPTEFDLLIDREQITCTTTDGTTIHIESGGRAANLSTAAAHLTGASFQEMIAIPKWIASDQGSDTVPSIYSVNEATGQLVRVETDLVTVTVDTADTTTVSGRTVTSLSIDNNVSIVYPAATIVGAEIPAFNAYRGINGDYESTDASYATQGSGSPGFVTLTFSTSNYSSTAGDFDSVTLSLWMTKHSSGVDEDILVQGSGGSPTYSTISSGTLPAAGSMPSRIDITISPIQTSDTHSIRLDPANSGTFRLFHAEITINMADKTVDQEADSVTASGTVTDKDNIIDGNDATFAQFSGTDNEYFELTFSQPAGVSLFRNQILHVLAKPTGGDQHKITGVSGSPDYTENATLPTYTTERWFHYYCDSVVNINVLRFATNQPADFGDIYRAYRTVMIGEPAADVPTQQLFADVDGVTAPGAGYQVSSGVLLEHPADIMKHWITVVGGETLNAASYSALVTSLGASAKWAFDARSMGFAFEEIIQRMAFEARCNIVLVEKSTGREWKLLAADNDYGFNAPAASAVITQTHDMTDVGRSVDDLASYFSFRYAYDPSLNGRGSEEGFKLALDANPSVSDVPITTTLITNASKRFGAVESGPIAFRAIQELATAQDVAGYYVQERMANDRRVYELRGVAWFDALPYDVGDIVSITAPWSSSATTCRITSMSKAFESNAWTITAVEVLETGLRT